MEERKARESRTQRRKKRRKETVLRIIRYIILYSIIAILSYMAYGIYVEAKVRNVEEGSNDELLINESNSYTKENTEKNQNIGQDFIPISANYEGYLVDCRLEIPKIDLQTNVLTNYTTGGLKICASKYYGPNANEVGNYCIAGHNYQRENMFNHLIDLSIGDSIFLTDNTNGKVEYTIYDIYKVKPENVEPLSQQTRGEREVTLITCVNYSTRRLVVKAIEAR